MQLELLNDWIDSVKLNEDERFVLNKYSIVDLEDYHNYDVYRAQVVDPLISMLPSSHIKTGYDIKFGLSATSLIGQCFDRYMCDEAFDDTLIITSNIEHINVQNVIKTYDNGSNVFVFNQKEEIHKFQYNRLNDFIKEQNKFKFAIVYVIGTQLSTGIITPNLFFKELRNVLDSFGITSVFICDDVQGMFVVPRNYSIFDHIIGTAHAIVGNFDLGIIVSREQVNTIGHRWITAGEDYIECLDVMLGHNRLLQYHRFNTVMQEVFAQEISAWGSKIYNKVAPNIFSIRLGDFTGNSIPFKTKSIVDMLDKHFIHVEGNDGKCNHQFLRLRAQELQYFTDEVMSGLEYLQKYLKMYRSMQMG